MRTALQTIALWLVMGATTVVAQEPPPCTLAGIGEQTYMCYGIPTQGDCWAYSYPSGTITGQCASKSRLHGQLRPRPNADTGACEWDLSATVDWWFEPVTPPPDHYLHFGVPGAPANVMATATNPRMACELAQPYLHTPAGGPQSPLALEVDGLKWHDALTTFKKGGQMGTWLCIWDVNGDGNPETIIKGGISCREKGTTQQTPHGAPCLSAYKPITPGDWPDSSEGAGLSMPLMDGPMVLSGTGTVEQLPHESSMLYLVSTEFQARHPQGGTYHGEVECQTLPSFN